MIDLKRQNDAEMLIVKYYEISKIRDQTERIRQFVELDIILRNYAEQVLKPVGMPKMRLSFVQNKNVRQNLRVSSHHEILPMPCQEEALVRFSILLAETMSY